MEKSESLPRYLFSELTLKDIRHIVRLKEQRVTIDSWFKEDQILLSEPEKQRIEYIKGCLLPYETTLMNEATIWGRAIYPMLLMSEKNDLQAHAEVFLEAEDRIVSFSFIFFLTRIAICYKYRFSEIKFHKETGRRSYSFVYLRAMTQRNSIS